MKKTLLILSFILVLSFLTMAKSPVGRPFTLAYLWNSNCQGQYYSTTISFAADGTFSIPQFQENGRWYTVNDYIILRFNNVPDCIYAGYILSDTTMAGMMMRSDSLFGCWNAWRPYQTTEKEEKIGESQEYNVVGEKLKK